MTFRLHGLKKLNCSEQVEISYSIKLFQVVERYAR